MGLLVIAAFAARVEAAPCPAGPNLILLNTSCELSGVQTYGTVTLTNSTINVIPYNGSGNKIATGNLEIRATTITIDATSRINAKGAGYQTPLCGEGAGPNTVAGGRGGCSVLDSGGGGAHFGIGGRGTKDIPGTPPAQVFPRDFEEDCGDLTTPGGVITCTATGGATCRDNDALPTIAGQPFVHSIYEPEFGASGGDKGCRDGDGRALMAAGGGGGRVVLAAVGGTGMITMNGTIDASGKRGCGDGNDSAGGGAGGTVFIAGDTVTIGASAQVSAAGGLGGDTQGAMSGGECAGFQQTGTCDDCGGGGGGGIVSVLSGVSANIHDQAVFNVNGALGGVCPICRGEAGGGVGELQISGGYVGEFCDGFDNDFDGVVDDNLPTLACGTMSMVACVAGVPQNCPADLPTCQGPVTDTRTRFTVILDTSGSMLGDLTGVPTHGDGSFDHPGLDHNGMGGADDSRLFKAKTALTNVIAAYPNIDFGLARYHQDQSLNRSCQTAHNFECNEICCSYDDPTNNTGPAPNPMCLTEGTNPLIENLAVLKDTPGDECINYAGNCGPPRRGADVLVGFGADINNYLMWLDGTETNFNNTQTQGAYCDFAAGGNCEMRGTGPTPLANSLQAVEDYLTPIKQCDLAATGGCRRYGVILLTDGAESCQGNPAAAAAALRVKGIDTFVIGFSTLPTETAQLNSIAASGGTGSAFLVGSDNELANALATIVSGSIVFETCNELDDDCDTRVDEDFPGKGVMCTNGALGVCRTTGTLVCRMDGSGLQCNAPVGPAPSTEICNMLDDDCDGKVDENLGSCACVPSTEVCGGGDNDCDGNVDENTEIPCGTGVCLGVQPCVGGVQQACTAPTPNPEQCNGVDDDCDGNADGFTQQCSNMTCPGGVCTAGRCVGGTRAGDDCGVFPAFDPLNNPGATHTPPTPCEALGAQCICNPGTRTCPLNGGGSFGACSGEIEPQTEICNLLDDDCDGLVDETPSTTCTTSASCPPITPTCNNPTGMPNMGTCEPADCSTNCGVGQLVCTNGMQMCNSVPAPDDDTCDGNDDDCDGMIDEDWVCDSPPGCGCTQAGVCNGVQSCQNGSELCLGTPVSQESCNCLDDDCDTNIDEGSLCPAGASCSNCQCAFQCSPGEFPCPLGKKCLNNFCIADPCFNVNCPDDAGGDKNICVDNLGLGVCVKACSTVNCAVGNVCIGSTGECKPDDCTTFPMRCAANQNCIVDNTGAGQCVTNPCQGVNCATDQYCVAGQCYGSCSDVTCPTGQRCRLGTCEADPCGKSCPFGQACNDESGTCVDDPCRFVTCQQGQWCNPSKNGVCEDDPCVGTACPDSGEVCKGGTCYDPNSFLPDAGVEEHVTTGGGGGCSTGGGGAGLLVGLLSLVRGLARRRRDGGAS